MPGDCEGPEATARLQFTDARFFVDADLAPLAELTDLRIPGSAEPAEFTTRAWRASRGLVEMHPLDLMDTQVTGRGAGPTALHDPVGIPPAGRDPRRDAVSDPSFHPAETALDSLDSGRRRRARRPQGTRPARSLDLSGTQVTDAGLEHLRGLKKLRTLRVRGTTVSSEAVAALRKELPLLAPEPPTPKRLTPRRRRRRRTLRRERDQVVGRQANSGCAKPHPALGGRPQASCRRIGRP